MQLSKWMVIVCVTIGAPSVRAEEFRSNEGRFRFQAPPNWVRFPQHKHDQAKRDARGGPKTVFHVGFEPRDLRPGFDGELPFLLAVEERQSIGPFVTYDMLERSLHSEIRKELEKQRGANFKLGKLTLDRNKARFAAPFEANEQGIGLKGMMYGFFGKNSFVLIACFARDFELARYQAEFDGVSDSFQWDAGFQFVPLDGSVLIAIVVGVLASGCCALAVVAIIIGVVIMALRR